jgi:hypothetical protein
MATEDDLAEYVALYHDNMEATDGSYSRRTDQLKALLKPVVLEILQRAQWPFIMVKESTLEVDAGKDSEGLPDDFIEIPADGRVIRNLDGRVMHEIPMADLAAIRQRPGFPDPPEVYAISAVFETTLCSVKTAFTMYYSGSDGSVDTIPARYHYSTVIKGLIAQAQESKGDARPYWERFERSLADMVRRERAGKSRRRQMPLARGGMA